MLRTRAARPRSASCRRRGCKASAPSPFAPPGCLCRATPSLHPPHKPGSPIETQVSSRNPIRYISKMRQWLLSSAPGFRAVPYEGWSVKNHPMRSMAHIPATDSMEYATAITAAFGGRLPFGCHAQAKHLSPAPPTAAVPRCRWALLGSHLYRRFFARSAHSAMATFATL